MSFSSGTSPEGIAELLPDRANVFESINLIRDARSEADHVEHLLLQGAEPYQSGENPITWAIGATESYGSIARFESDEETAAIAEATGLGLAPLDPLIVRSTAMRLPAELTSVYWALGCGCIQPEVYGMRTGRQGFPIADRDVQDIRDVVLGHLAEQTSPRAGGAMDLEECICRIRDALKGPRTLRRGGGIGKSGFVAALAREIGRPVFEIDPQACPGFLVLQCRDSNEAERVSDDFGGQTPTWVSGRLTSLPRQMLGVVAQLELALGR